MRFCDTVGEPRHVEIACVCGKIVALSGSVTASGVAAIILLMACAEAVRKCPEAPESLSA